MNNKESSVSNNPQEPWSQAWPSSGLEFVSKCPVCGESKRKMLHADVVDNVFRVAPGKWTLWQCADCNSAYLDPRPTQNSIGQAYTTYYTHNSVVGRDELSFFNKFRLFRRMLANGYMNNRYGTNYHPTSAIGPVFAGLFSDQREVLDIQFRWLLKPIAGQRLLDVGCGNGEFLVKARDAGWDVVGVDPDPNAVATAQEQGLDVYTGFVNVLDGGIDPFDIITLSQVIEHIHEPMELLSSVHEMLKPNGILYIDTPNIQSLGARLFGINWRGIESPRHLVLFSITGLILLLERCGFTDIQFRSRRYATKGMFKSSFRLEREASLGGIKTALLSTRMVLNTYIPFLPVSSLDFITLLARKKH